MKHGKVREHVTIRIRGNAVGMNEYSRLTSPEVGGTRGGAKDASERVKAQAVILFYKKLAASAVGAKKMAAYAYAAVTTGNSESSVRAWVKLEGDLGMDALESRRDNCGALTRFSPSKKARVDQLMEETEGEATCRQVKTALDLGSTETAASYIKLSGYTRLTKRLKPLLSPAHMQARLKYVEANFGSEWAAHFMTDEKLFVLGLGKKWRYVKAEDADKPCIKFIDNTNHPPQLMITAIVGRPDLAKGFDGKVALDFTCAKWQQAVNKSKNRPAGTWEIVPDGTLDGPAYADWLSTVGFHHMSAAMTKLRCKTAGAVLQDDNAPPHVRAWSTAPRTGCNVGAEAAKHNIKRSEQPARSPDLNVLDLYIWRVLEAGVHRRRPKTLVELWEALQAAWAEDLTPAKIECAYRLMDPVMSLIQAGNGGNAFKLPHTGITKDMRENGGWDI